MGINAPTVWCIVKCLSWAINTQFLNHLFFSHLIIID